jgi:hypothetical protein
MAEPSCNARNRMTKERPCCPAAADPAIAQLILPDGSPVGMLNLERILRQVTDLKCQKRNTGKKG